MITRRDLMAAGLLWLCTRRASAQSGGEVIQDTAEYQGVKADAPIEKESRQQNIGSEVDGAGLCVIASCVMILRDVGEPELAAYFWERAKKEPGGYDPGKLKQLFDEVKDPQKCPQFKGKVFDYDFCTSGDWVAWARKWISRGYSLGITYGRGDRYPNRIAHMVVLEHIDPTGEWGLICDNNFVDGSVTRDTRGPRSWIRMSELKARVEMMGGPWCVAIKTARHPRSAEATSAEPLPDVGPFIPVAAVGLGLAGAALYLAPDPNAPQPEAA